MQRQKVKELEQICRERGIRLTRQRRVILKALAGRRDHPTADQLCDEVRETMPEISRTTVYRVLEMLVGVNVARSVSHPGSAARYEANTVQHHHLFCVRCDRLIDIVDPTLDAIPIPRAKTRGFRIDDVSVQFRGVCSECRRRTD